MRLQSLIKNVLLGSHPVGTIYMTTDSSFNPQDSWGGQWQKIEDRFLVGASSTYSIGSTGGESRHTLLESEMPSHFHSNLNVDGVAWIGWSEGAAWGINLNKEYSNVVSPSRLTTNHVGGGQPHNNMPPYLAVNIWKRIA